MLSIIIINLLYCIFIHRIEFHKSYSEVIRSENSLFIF